MLYDVICFDCSKCLNNGRCEGLLHEVKALSERDSPTFYCCRKYDGKKIMEVVKK